MDTLTQDIWGFICNYLSTYDFVTCGRLSRRFYVWYNTDAWIKRAAFHLNVPLSPEFRELFNLPSTQAYIKYLYALAWGGRVERYSRLILPPLDCLTFAFMMEDVELVEYFTILTFGCSVVDSELFLSIINLRTDLRCYLAMIKNINTLSSEVRLGFNLNKHKSVTDEETKEIFRHASRIDACSPLISRVYSVAKKYGHLGIHKVAITEKHYFGGTINNLKDIDDIEGLTPKERLFLAHSWALSRGRVKYSNPSAQIDLISSRDSFTFPNMTDLWSWKMFRPVHSSDEWGMVIIIRDLLTKVNEEHLKQMFPDTYLSKLPIMLHSCGICYHYCTDINHQCCH